MGTKISKELGFRVQLHPCALCAEYLLDIKFGIPQFSPKPGKVQGLGSSEREWKNGKESGNHCGVYGFGLGRP